MKHRVVRMAIAIGVLAAACADSAPDSPAQTELAAFPGLYAAAFDEMCSGRCRAIDTVYVVDQGGELGEEVRAALRGSDAATPFFVESMDHLADEEGFYPNARRAFTFGTPRSLGDGVFAIDVDIATSRFDSGSQTLLFRATDGTWVSVLPEEVGGTVTTSVS